MYSKRLVGDRRGQSLHKSEKNHFHLRNGYFVWRSTCSWWQS